MDILYLILRIIAIIIIFIIILLFLFLYFGIKANIKLNKDDNDFNGIIEVRWTFIKIFSKNLNDNDKDIKNKNKKDNKRDKKNWRNLDLYSLYLKIYFNDIFSFILVCINSISIKKFNTSLKLGFSSPVCTVKVVSYIWIFSAIPNRSKYFYLSAEPIFVKETVDLIVK